MVFELDAGGGREPGKEIRRKEGCRRRSPRLVWREDTEWGEAGSGLRGGRVGLAVWVWPGLSQTLGAG